MPPHCREPVTAIVLTLYILTLNLACPSRQNGIFVTIKECNFWLFTLLFLHVCAGLNLSSLQPCSLHPLVPQYYVIYLYVIYFHCMIIASKIMLQYCDHFRFLFISIDIYLWCLKHYFDKLYTVTHILLAKKHIFQLSPIYSFTISRSFIATGVGW